ncbi:MAG: hypothetical protein V3V41_07940 [Candidatus Heimdallarchaeota archaeon]
MSECPKAWLVICMQCSNTGECTAADHETVTVCNSDDCRICWTEEVS